MTKRDLNLMLTDCRKLLIRDMKKYGTIDGSAVNPRFLELACEYGVLRQQDEVYQADGILKDMPDLTGKELLFYFNRTEKERALKKTITPVAVQETTDNDTEVGLLDNPVLTPHLGKIVKIRKALTSVIKIGTKSKSVETKVSWYSTHAAEKVQGEKWQTLKAYYSQEHFELDGKLYSVVDFEETMGKAVNDFFDGKGEVIYERIHTSETSKNSKYIVTSGKPINKLE